MTEVRIYNEDNLEFLKRTRRKYQLIYLDPPYGIGIFDEDDITDRKAWKKYMKPRLELCKNRLSEAGTLWLQLDDKMQPVARLMLDDMFGMDGFVANVVWRRKRGGSQLSHNMLDVKDHIFIYSNQKGDILNTLPHHGKGYSNPDNDPRGPWAAKTLFTNTNNNPPKELEMPDGRTLEKKWYHTQKSFDNLIEEDRIFWNENDIPYKKVYLSENEGMLPETIFEDFQNVQATYELKTRFGSKVHPTPKPLGLMQKIIHIATDKGDNILDPFGGTGSTVEAAIRMDRNVDVVERDKEYCDLIEQRLQWTKQNEVENPCNDDYIEPLDWGNQEYERTD